jgi:eukaryotic-like serine/threonine-protein kinase
MVFEGVDGNDFYDWQAQHLQGLTADDARLLVADVIAGLQHAHGHGCAHRDIKYENVMVCREDDRWRARLIDFGLGKRIPEEHAERTDSIIRTASGDLAAPPEVHSGVEYDPFKVGSRRTPTS